MGSQFALLRDLGSTSYLLPPVVAGQRCGAALSRRLALLAKYPPQEAAVNVFLRASAAQAIPMRKVE